MSSTQERLAEFFCHYYYYYYYYCRRVSSRVIHEASMHVECTWSSVKQAATTKLAFNEAVSVATPATIQSMFLLH